jgi:hypothetical protein
MSAATKATRAERDVPLLMTRKPAAALLGLSVSTFWRLEQRGAIPRGVLVPGLRGRYWHRDTLVGLAARWMQRR